MAQKDIEGCHVTWWRMHVILRWLKVRTIQFLFNFCSKYWSRVKILRWLTFFSSKILRWLKIRIIFASNSISLRILSHLRIFELKKVSQLRILTRDQYFEQKLKRNWMVRTLSHLKITCIPHHVTWHPSMSFWAISKYLPYHALCSGLPNQINQFSGHFTLNFRWNKPYLNLKGNYGGRLKIWPHQMRLIFW